MTANPAYPPRLSDGAELLGEFKDSGYTRPPSLIRRADGQVVQLSRLLYLIARLMDGNRNPADIAELASGELGRSLSPGQVCYLIVAKMAPLGILAGAGTAALSPASPLLGLRARGTLLPARAANAAGTLLRPLFHWPVIAAVTGSVVAGDCWLFSGRGLGDAFGQILSNPLNLLLVAALSLVSAAFHECGHAAGCRYGGARPGRIGVGIYLVWPSFFTNVTDSYRLGRAGRLRTDLGGLYFNLIFILALTAVYGETSEPLLVLVVAVTHLEMLQQLLPFARFDGYFILSDLVGVPDLFGRVVPVLRSTFGEGRADPRVTGLRPRARAVITGWVLCVIPLLTFTLGYLVLRFPAAGRALGQSAAHSARLMSAAVAGHHYAAAAADAIGAALAAVSMAGSLFVMTGLLRRAVTLGARWSAGRPRRRLVAVLAGAACAAALLCYWVTSG
ncbi:MAG TPA: hypothetical protein VHF26_00340 [Trebonia sp.]|nr:hypothetical protein [Trebonia sp.]